MIGQELSRDRKPGFWPFLCLVQHGFWRRSAPTNTKAVIVVFFLSKTALLFKKSSSFIIGEVFRDPDFQVVDLLRVY